MRTTLLLVMALASTPSFAGSFCSIDRQGREDCSDGDARRREISRQADQREAEIRAQQLHGFVRRCAGSTCYYDQTY